jgi:dipeptidase
MQKRGLHRISDTPGGGLADIRQISRISRKGGVSRVRIKRLLRWRRRVFAAFLGLGFLASNLAAQVPGCSTVVVGKKASLMGEVLLGHNEDNEGRLVVACYRMPRLKHAPGEMIAAEEGKAKIPQVAETAAFLWWETIAEWKASYSDNFVNEYGVAVVSDSCWPSKEEKGELAEGGIGYGLRRVIAERARTAREGVDIAAAHVDRYGYADSGRTYIIADKNEGWLFEVVMGKHYVARRVADDEVAFIPNWYTIRDVDFRDKERWVVSPDLVSYAAKREWFAPKALRDGRGFDFAKAYMSPVMFDTNWKPTNDPRQDYNVLRHKYALEMITGKSFGYGQDYPFAVKPAHKLGLEDLMALLRTHYEGKPDYRTTSPPNSPHSLATICASETQESLIIQFREDPDFTVVWWTAGRPCTSVYVPWYLGIQRVPDGYGWKDPVEGMKGHFSPAADDLSRNPQRAWWAFMDLQNGLEPRYLGDGKGHETGTEAQVNEAGSYAGNEVLGVQKRWRELEKEWLARQKAVEDRAVAAGKKNADGVREYLTRYTSDQAKKAWATAREMAGNLQGIIVGGQPEKKR